MNVKPSNSQLNKLKLAIKEETDVVLKLSSKMIGNSDYETNFPHKLLLTNSQVTNLKVSEYLFFLEIEKYCFFLHKTMEKPYLNLHFKFHDFFQ